MFQRSEALRQGPAGRRLLIRCPEPHRVPPCHALRTFPTGCHNRTLFCCNIVAAHNGAALRPRLTGART